MRGGAAAGAALLGALMISGCEGGVVVELEADPLVLEELTEVGIAVAGWDEDDGGGRTSQIWTRCFPGGDLPLTVGIHQGDDFHERAALRVEAWRSGRLWFVHEELLVLNDEVADHSITLSERCADCEGEFCTGRGGCRRESAIGIFADDLEPACP